MKYIPVLLRRLNQYIGNGPSEYGNAGNNYAGDKYANGYRYHGMFELEAQENRQDWTCPGAGNR